MTFNSSEKAMRNSHATGPGGAMIDRRLIGESHGEDHFLPDIFNSTNFTGGASLKQTPDLKKSKVMRFIEYPGGSAEKHGSTNTGEDVFDFKL